MNLDIQSTAPEEDRLFYTDTEKDLKTGCIGHLRGDFGSGGKEFWTSWWEHQGAPKTQAFRDEFDELVNSLHDQGLLKSRNDMAAYCEQHQEAQISSAWLRDSYGFRVETEKHRYYIRCTPRPGDYNFYIYCYSKEPERDRDQPSREAHAARPKHRKDSEPER